MATFMCYYGLSMHQFNENRKYLPTVNRCLKCNKNEIPYSIYCTDCYYHERNKYNYINCIFCNDVFKGVDNLSTHMRLFCLKNENSRYYGRLYKNGYQVHEYADDKWCVVFPTNNPSPSNKRKIFKTEQEAKLFVDNLIKD